MKRIKTTAWLLISFLCPILVFSQNNLIFSGGTGDGWNAKIYVQQSASIFKGGIGDGWATRNYQQASGNIFKGGTGDGWAYKNYIQSSLGIFRGGAGDGWNYKNYVQASTGVFKGGIGDGWASNYRPQGPLPVSFTSFTATKLNGFEAVLKWTTASEFNSSFYDVEKSTDAAIFQKIGTVQAAGNSTVALAYEFIDHHGLPGLNYYRLKQVDLDGKFKYTPVRVVKFGEAENSRLRYFPNPTRGLLFVELTPLMAQEQKLVNISNAGGLMVDQFRVGNTQGNKLTIDMSRYASGTYFIQVKTATTSSTHRVVLQ